LTALACEVCQTRRKEEEKASGGLDRERGIRKEIRGIPAEGGRA